MKARTRMKTGCIALALLAGLIFADAVEARTIRVRTKNGVYYYYGSGGRRAARAYAARYYARKYSLRRNTTPVQRDAKQKEALKFKTFPSITSLTNLLVYIEPSQKAAQKDVAQKATQKAKASHHHGHLRGGKARRAARRSARAARRK